MVHVRNICCILVTLDVFQLETSKDVKLEQPENIASIVVTLAVLKPETSKDVKLLQP